MSKVRPRIAEVNCTPMRFQPGDRVLVKVYRSLDSAQRKKLRRGIEKWAGDCVEVLIYDATEMEISVEQRKERGKVIVPE